MRRVGRTAAIALILVAALVGVLSARGSGGSSDRAANAAQRAAVIAPGMGLSQARRAALLALAGDRLQPTVAGEEAMLEVALRSSGVERVLESDASRITAAIRLEHLILGAGGDNVLRVWRPASGTLIGTVKTKHPLMVIGEAANMPLAVGADASGAVSLIDLADPHHPRLLSIDERGRHSPVLALGFSQAGAEVLVVRSDGTLERISTDDRQVVRRELLRGAREGLVCAQFESPSSGPPTAILLGLSNGEVVRVSVGDNQRKVLVPAGVARGTITSLAAAPYGGEVAVGTRAGLITLEDPTSTPYVQGGPPVSGVAFNAEENLLVSGEEGVARWTDAYSEEGKYGRPAIGLSVGQGGVLALNPDGAISVLGQISSGVGLPSTVYSPVVSFRGGGGLLLAEGWSATHIERLEVVRPGHENEEGFVTTDPEIRSLEPAKSWWREGEETDQGTAWYVNDVASNSDFIVAGGQDPTGEAVVLVWDADSGRPLRRLPLATGGLDPEEPSIVAEVALIPDKHLLAAYSAIQQTVVIWSTETWQLEASIPVGPVGALALSPDQSTLMAVGLPEDEDSWQSGNGTSKLIAIDTETMKIEGEAKSTEVDRAAYSPDGSRLALLGLDGTLRIRSADGATELRRPIHLEAQPLALVWRPDGALIAVSLENSGVTLVDPQSGERTAPLPIESKDVLDLSWSPDGRFLAASPASEDEETSAMEPEAAEIWTLSRARLERRMCQLAGGPISHQEWQRVVDRKLPYQSLCQSHASLPASSQRHEPIVLGSMVFAPTGLGWGRVEPERIFNGGDPSGDVSAISWRDWGGPEAIGFGRTSIFKPTGGYYPRPGRIELRAHGVGRCGLQRAYTKLSVRVPLRPGAGLGRWGSWSGTETLCRGIG
jgi:WD40 repeat protein